MQGFLTTAVCSRFNVLCKSMSVLVIEFACLRSWFCLWITVTILFTQVCRSRSRANNRILVNLQLKNLSFFATIRVICQLSEEIPCISALVVALLPKVKSSLTP